MKKIGLLLCSIVILLQTVYGNGNEELKIKLTCTGYVNLFRLRCLISKRPAPNHRNDNHS